MTSQCFSGFRNCSICEEESEEYTNLKDEALTLKLDGSNSSLHDTITFAIRDNFSPRLWADADDIAETVIKAVTQYRESVSEDEFLDNLAGNEDDDRMVQLLSRIAEILDSVYFPNVVETTQLSLDAADALIDRLDIRPEWGSLDENNDGVLADSKEDLKSEHGAVIKSRYITEWESHHD